MKNLFKNIFSINNTPDKKYKIVTLFGINFSFKIDEIKRNKRLSKEYFNRYHKRYIKTLGKIRLEAKTRKIRVCFIVQETSKWNMQSLYDKMKESEIFEPFVVVTKLNSPEIRQSFEHTLDFYSKITDVKIGWDEKQEVSIDLKEFSPDIVFYQQPYHQFENQCIEYVSNFALCSYCPYCICASLVMTKQYLQYFLLKLFVHFVFSDIVTKQYEEKIGYVGYNTVPIGHVKLDAYKEYQQENFEHKYIIYAPHHSISDNSIMHFGTFSWSGQAILEFAKNHPEFNWIFKPHPTLKERMYKIYGQKMTDEYYREWEKFAFCYFDGNYFDYFKNSKCMITDCSSFLTEYFPTLQPVIHLKNKSCAEFNIINQIVSKVYYPVYTKEELSKTLNEILIKNNDYMKPQREELHKKMNINFDVGVKIYSYFEDLILNRKVNDDSRLHSGCI